ncbi:phage minor head protein [Flavobacterium sp.]|uniref:phage head morphogenesis protein n=1 Tax=Flavobacterium sp. TaxID=239 RepID=UPI00375337C2
MEHQTIQLDKKADAGLSRLIENYIRQLFDERDVSPANQTKLWSHYYNTLSKGVDLGYNPKPEMYDPQLAHSLKYDIAKFSAFKETSFRKQLEAALTKDGKIQPWSEFKKTADSLNIDYNRRWLKTEYNHTVATANMAEKWQDFEADKDLYPNLKYVTAGDARVRDAHKILDGLILPINHPFWKTHTTPLDWGCRCNIEQTDDEPSKIIPSYKVKEEFQNNAFYSGKIFNKSTYESGLNGSEIKEANADANKNFNTVLRGKDKELLSWAATKIKRGEYLGFTGNQFKLQEVRVSKSTIENVLNHISIIEHKDIVKDFDLIFDKAKFLNFEDLNNLKSNKNYGKKVARGVTGYNYYISEWKGLEIKINMEVMKNGYEQPYAIIFNKK